MWGGLWSRHSSWGGAGGGRLLAKLRKSCMLLFTWLFGLGPGFDRELITLRWACPVLGPTFHRPDRAIKAKCQVFNLTMKKKLFCALDRHNCRTSTAPLQGKLNEKSNYWKVSGKDRIDNKRVKWVKCLRDQALFACCPSLRSPHLPVRRSVPTWVTLGSLAALVGFGISSAIICLSDCPWYSFFGWQTSSPHPLMYFF